MKKGRLYCLFALLAVLPAAVFGGCGQRADEGGDPVYDDGIGHYHKYSQTLQMRVGQWVADEKNFPEGQTPEKNDMYDLVEKHTNIKIVPAVKVSVGQTFYDRINELQMSDALPDMTAMDTKTFRDAVEAEQLADLTDVFEQYASPTLKRVIGSNNGLYMDLGSSGGKLYGIPRPATLLDGVSVAWIRKDWIEIADWHNGEGGLAPRTFEELESLAYAFKNRIGAIASATDVSNPYPIAMYKDLVTPFMGIMNAHKAYPGAFIRAEAGGEIKYGTFTPETAAGFKTLNKYQSDGIFSSDWATKATTDIAAESAQGRVGIFIDEFWAPLANQLQGLMGVALSDNPGRLAGADWICVPMPAMAGETMESYSRAEPLEYYAVNKDFYNKEALVILMNFIVEKYNAEGTRENGLGAYFPFETEYKELDGKYSGRSIFNWLPVIIDDPQKNILYSDSLVRAAASGDPAELTGEVRGYYDIMTGNPTTAKERLDKWVWNRIYGEGGSVQAAKRLTANLVPNAYLGAPTPAMNASYAYLKNTLELNRSIQIVTTSMSDSQLSAAMNKFKGDWESNGGAKILEEINRLAA
ncbi:MAG: extracellular solute-binding protein [Clostridiales bacterium]|nr:extracellular solute-binding protein [Clostridiales bacterium]